MHPFLSSRRFGFGRPWRADQIGKKPISSIGSCRQLTPQSQTEIDPFPSAVLRFNMAPSFSPGLSLQELVIEIKPMYLGSFPQEVKATFLHPPGPPVSWGILSYWSLILFNTMRYTVGVSGGA